MKTSIAKRTDVILRGHSGREREIDLYQADAYITAGIVECEGRFYAFVAAESAPSRLVFVEAKLVHITNT